MMVVFIKPHLWLFLFPPVLGDPCLSTLSFNFGVEFVMAHEIFTLLFFLSVIALLLPQTPDLPVNFDGRDTFFEC